LTIIFQNFHDIFDLSFCILRLHSENVLKLSSFFSFIILMMSNILIHEKANIWPLPFRLPIQLALDILLVSHIPHKCWNLFSYVAFEFCMAVQINTVESWVMRPYCIRYGSTNVQQEHTASVFMHLQEFSRVSTQKATIENLFNSSSLFLRHNPTKNYFYSQN